MKIIIGLLFSIFMGMMAISLGLGTVFPVVNNVAQPIVCPDGEMSAQRTATNPRPGETYIEASWTCASASGAKQPINKFLLTLYAGTIYGLGMFAFFWIILKLGRRS